MKKSNRRSTVNSEQLKELLDDRVAAYNRPAFIPSDPICIPHRYSRKQDVEITGFWTAVLSWGQRKTIIAKADALFSLMGKSPYEFVVNHSEADREPFEQFVHRTFQPTDTLYFLAVLQDYYRKHDSLEQAFISDPSSSVYHCIAGFHERFFSYDWAPGRTRKHVSTPVRGSSCKRLNMFLRWMVRNDDCGVDFGLWKNLSPADLMMPLDVHVHRVARNLGLLHRPQADWKSVEFLTKKLREFDPRDPVKYDFALFGIGVLEKDWPLI